MRHIKLSIITMIVTGFILKVISKFRNSRLISPYSHLAQHIGVDPNAYEAAVEAAKVVPDWKILLFFERGNRNAYFNIGKSLGPACDELIAKWCNEHLGLITDHNGTTYRFLYVDIQPVDFENFNQRLSFPPMEAEHMENLLNLYNSLLSKAK